MVEEKEQGNNFGIQNNTIMETSITINVKVMEECITLMGHCMTGSGNKISGMDKDY